MTKTLEQEKDGALNLASYVAQEAIQISDRLRRAQKPAHIHKAAAALQDAFAAINRAWIPWED